MEERVYRISDEEVESIAKRIADGLFVHVYGLILKEFPVTLPAYFTPTMERIGSDVLEVALAKYYQRLL